MLTEVGSSVVEMTEQLVLEQCKAHKGYSTPELNEKLYLHHFGFTKIRNLDPYIGCKVLYITHNAITDLSPLEALVNLDSLYVSNNSIDSLASLPSLPHLRLLDISHNSITGLTDLQYSPLETLLASHNTIRSLHGLEKFTSLSSLDASHNRLEGFEDVDEALRHISASMRTLVLSGNRVVQSTPHYRKTVIHSYAFLTFLDEYPIFSEERLKAQAFSFGGEEAERDVARALKARDEEERQAQFQYFTDARNEARQRRNEEKPKEKTDYFKDQESDIYIPGR